MDKLKKFWEFMEEKGYAEFYDGSPYLLASTVQDGDTVIIEYSHDLIVSYMMEYLDEKSPGWQRDFFWIDCDSTEKRVKWLENKIESLRRNDNR